MSGAELVSFPTQLSAEVRPARRAKASAIPGMPQRGLASGTTASGDSLGRIRSGSLGDIGGFPCHSRNAISGRFRCS